MPSQKVKLEICGSTYVVSTNDSEEYITALSERLDEDMNRIMLEAPNASVTAAAVMCALSYLDDVEKTNNGADNMRAQIQDYLEDAVNAKMATENARREVEQLRNELSFFEQKFNMSTKSILDEPLPRPIEIDSLDDLGLEQLDVEDL